MLTCPLSGKWMHGAKEQLFTFFFVANKVQNNKNLQIWIEWRLTIRNEQLANQ